MSVTVPSKSLSNALSHVRMGDVLIVEGGSGDTIVVVREEPSFLRWCDWPNADIAN